MYVREQNNGSLGDLLDGLDLGEKYLLDINHWVSHRFLHVLYHRMIAILGDDNAVYKMALSSGRFQSLEILVDIARLLGSPKLIYAQAHRYNRLLKLNGDVYIHELGDSWVVLEDRYHNSGQKTRYDCDYTRGVLVGIPTVFDLPPAHVEEIECQVAPDTYGKRIWPDNPPQGSRGCLYRVRWEKGIKISLWKRLFGRLAIYKNAIDNLQEVNRRIQEKYDEVRMLASDLERANRHLIESKQQLESKAADLLASEERYRFLAENISDIIWTLNLENMRFDYVTPSVQSMRGFTVEEAMQLSLEQTLAPPSYETVTRILAEELEKEGKVAVDPERNRTIEVQQLCKNGSYIWAEATVSFIRDKEGRPVGVLGVTRDISGRKRAEEDLRSSHDELEIRVGERTAQLQESESRLRVLASELINAQERERKRIAAELHDSICVSLATIKISMEKKLNQMKEGFSPSGVKLEDIIIAVQHTNEETRKIMNNLRPGMLDDLGLLPTLNWYFREFQKLNSQIALRKEIQLVEEDLPDPIKIVVYRLIQEALNNVVKHSHAKAVWISMTREDGEIKLAIRDNGDGFDLAQVETEKEGMGLINMKERVQLSGGSFSIESSEGKGASIYASWLIEPPKSNEQFEMKFQVAKPMIVSLNSNPIKSIKIMIVEDNAAFRKSIIESIRLLSSNIDIQEVEDGSSCLEKVDVFHPDLVFMDIQLPGENGLSLTKKIKEKYPEMEVIIMTSYDNPEYRDTSLKLGASQFFPKDRLNLEEIRVLLNSVRSG